MNKPKHKIVVVGASAGAMSAFTTLFSMLPKNFPAPIVAVCHRQASPDSYLTEYLSSICAMQVEDVENLANIEKGKIYISPPGYHVLISDDFTFNLTVDELVNFARPSIDVTFDTAAEVYGNSVMGIILTGANRDGALGLKHIKEAGGIAIIENPETAEVAFMPTAAMQEVSADFVGSLTEIAEFLCKYFSVKVISHEK